MAPCRQAATMPGRQLGRLLQVRGEDGRRRPLRIGEAGGDRHLRSEVAGQAETPRPRPRPGDLLDALPRAVLRAVVDEDDLHVPVRGLGDRPQAGRELRQALGVEVDGNDDRDELAVMRFFSKNDATAAHHGFDLRVRERGVERQGDDGLAGVLGNGEVSLLPAEKRVRGLKVERDGVVDGRLDAARRQVLAERLPLLRSDRDRGGGPGPSPGASPDEAQRKLGEGGVVTVRDLEAAGVLARERRAASPRGWPPGARRAASSSPRVSAKSRRLQPYWRSCRSRPAGLGVVGRHGAAVPVGAEILGGVEREGRGSSERARRAALEKGAVALRAVLDERQLPSHPRAQRRPAKVREPSVEMDGEQERASRA